MFNKENMFINLKRLKVGETLTLQLDPGVDSDALLAAIDEFESRYSVKLIANQSPESITLLMEWISYGSPITARKPKPWHALAIGESVFVSSRQHPRHETLRCYVSQQRIRLHPSEM